MSDVNRAAILAAELAKTHVFLEYVQRKVPSLGQMSAFTSEVTQQLKDQAEKNGGISPFVPIFEKVKDIAPGVAGEGFAKAQGFVEYIVRESPGVFNEVQDFSGDILGVIQAHAPAVFAAAQNAGETLASVVAQNGPEVLEGIQQAGGSIMKLFSAAYPHVIKDVLPVAAEGGSAMVEGASVAGNAVSQLLSAGLPELTGIGRLAVRGLAAAAILAPGALGDAASAVGNFAGVAGDALGSVLNAEIGADVANFALQVIGTSAAVFPFLLPLQIALRDVGLAVQQASYNKEAASELGIRCEDCSKIVAEMAPRISKVSDTEAAAKEMLRPFISSVDECTEELKKFAKKGFLSHMFSCKKEGRLLTRLDKRLTDSMQALSMRVDGKMMDLQLANSQKLDGLQLMLNNAAGNVTEITSMPPEKVADILQQAGCKSSSEVSLEMKSVGFKMEDIAKGINAIANKLEKMDAKLDVLDSKLDSMNNDISKKLDRMLDINAEKAHALELANQRMLDAMRDINEKLVQIPLAMMRQKGSGGVAHQPEVFSTANQVEYLSKRCTEIKGKCQNIIYVHPFGVGEDKFQTLDGASGMSGPHGQSFPHARNGAPGSSPGADGEDGLDGDDGLDGEEGHDGDHGDNAEPFEIMIEFVKEDKETGSREYHIEHAGPSGKDDHTVIVPLLNSMIFINGRGGNGGRGGDGGNGGQGADGGVGGNGADGRDTQDGGSGGSGGAGGSGGNGGMAGSGGKGANGGRVVIHTNDPSVLTLMEFDVDGGDSGLPGNHGQPGMGGAGGNPGEGGQGGVYYDYRADGAAVPRRARNGHRGKAGKKGKNGRPAPQKQSKSGSSGSPGKISFCIYDESGLKESGGTPFRVVLNRKDLPKLVPIPISFGKECPGTDPFIFGESLKFGPVLPINIGSITAPASKLLGSVSLQTSHAVERGMVRFHIIPGENKTRYGELPPSCAETMIVKVPKLKDSGFSLHANVWPWPKSWSPTPASVAKFNTIFNIDGILQKASSMDVEHASTRQYDIPVDVPMEIVSSDNAHGVSVPDSVVFADNQSSIEIVVSLRNKLKGSVIADGIAKLQLCVAGLRFKAAISTLSAKKITLLEAPPQAANDSGYLIVAAQITIPPISPSATQDFSFSVKIPPDSRQLGANMIVKAEVFFDNVLCQFCPARLVRIAAPWPVQGTPTANDLIFFCDENFSTEDFAVLSTLSFTLKMRAVFLDYQHLAKQHNGHLPANVWAHHVGKGIAVWIPSNANLASLVPSEDFVQHIRAGGSVVCGEKSVLALPPDLAHVASLPGRRAITLSSDFSLSTLRQGVAIDEKRIAGPSIAALALGILTSLPMERKLQVVADLQLASVMVGEMKLDSFQVVVEAGCCGCGSSSRVFPAQKTPVTIRDIIVSACRTDICAELAVFEQTSNINYCASIPLIRNFATSNVLGKSHSPAIAALARDIHAIMYASQLLDESKFVGPLMAIWSPLQTQMKLEAGRLESIAHSHNYDVMSSDERALDGDVLVGFSRRSPSVNIGRGNKFVMMK